MEKRKLEKLLKQCQELESTLDKLLQTEDVTMNDADVLYGYAEDISDKLKSFHIYQPE